MKLKRKRGRKVPQWRIAEFVAEHAKRMGWRITRNPTNDNEKEP
jgi:hypothetical protein